MTHFIRNNRGKISNHSTLSCFYLLNRFQCWSFLALGLSPVLDWPRFRWLFTQGVRERECGVSSLMSTPLYSTSYIKWDKYPKSTESPTRQSGHWHTGDVSNDKRSKPLGSQRQPISSGLMGRTVTPIKNFDYCLNNPYLISQGGNDIGVFSLRVGPSTVHLVVWKTREDLRGYMKSRCLLNFKGRRDLCPI